MPQYRFPLRPRRTGWMLLVLGAVLVLAPRAAAQWPDDGQPVCVAAGEQYAAQVAPFHCLGFCPGPFPPSVNLLAVWQDRRVTGTTRLYWQGVAWPLAIPQPGGEPVASDHSQQYHPSIVEGSGGVCVVWTDDDPARPTGPDIRIRRLFAPGDLQPPPWPDTGYAVCRAPGTQQASSASASFVSASTVIAWEDRRAGGPSVYAQSIDGYGVARWIDDGVAVCDTTGECTGIRIATDGMDGGYVAWVDNRDGHDQVYLTRLDASGAFAPGWPKQGRAVAAGPGDQSLAGLLSSPSGGVVVVWQTQADAGGTNVARVVLLEGDGEVAPGWPEGGAILSDLEGACTVTDAGIAGEYIPLSFVHDPTPEAPENGDADAWAQMWRLDGTRAPNWPAAGLPLCPAGGDPSGLRQATSGNGVVYAWSDARHGASETDIYAQRIEYSGYHDPRWPADGVLINGSPGKQGSPQLVGNGYAGATILWRDGRDIATTDYDLYAMIVSGSGQVEAPTGVPAALRLSSATPNPSRGPVEFDLEMPLGGEFRAMVVDVAGRVVRELADGTREPGRRTLRWDGLDHAGRPAGPGLYYLRVRTSAGDTGTRFVMLR